MLSRSREGIIGNLFAKMALASSGHRQTAYHCCAVQPTRH
jgi:hypothetical protein